MRRLREDLVARSDSSLTPGDDLPSREKSGPLNRATVTINVAYSRWPGVSTLFLDFSLYFSTLFRAVSKQLFWATTTVLSRLDERPG